MENSNSVNNQLNKKFPTSSEIKEITDLQVQPEVSKAHSLELDLKNETDQEIAANLGVINLVNIIKTLQNYSENRGEGFKKILKIYQRLKILEAGIEDVRKLNPEIARHVEEWLEFITEIIEETKKDAGLKKVINEETFKKEISEDKSKYKERFYKLLNTRGGEELIRRYLLPENVERLSDEIFYEYLEIITDLSRQLLIEKISKPSKGKITLSVDQDGVVKKETSTEIEILDMNIEEVKERVKNLYKKAEKLKIPGEEAELENIDKEVYKISNYRVKTVNATVEDSTGKIYKFLNSTTAVIYCCLMGTNKRRSNECNCTFRG